MTKSDLLSELRVMELQSSTPTIRFRDGDTYIIRVISTIHAEEGDDIVAEVIQTISPPKAASIPKGAVMNFLLTDVAQITIDDC